MNIPITKLALNKLTGISVPLGALYTNESFAIGEYPALKKLIPFCKETGIKIIQLLPVNDTGTQSSPYSGLSAFALHPIYIQISALEEFEVASKNKEFAAFYESFLNAFTSEKRYNYEKIANAKDELLRKIFEAAEVLKNKDTCKKLDSWIKENEWIKNYAVFKVLKYKFMQRSWKEWPKEFQNCNINERWSNEALRSEHLFYAWVQFRSSEQFLDASNEVKKNDIILKGDMPILMNEDSCDTWAYPEFFNHQLRAGSPVDGENPTGQNWGFPTYNWENLKAKNYSWWKERLLVSSKYYDAYRLDHILGFFRIWAVPERETTALLGHAVPYESISKATLNTAGFNDDRIRWLSLPHIPTSDIEYFTWNHELAHKILSVFATKIDGEELWRFSKSIQGDKDILEKDLSSLCNEELANKIKTRLREFWFDRALIEITKDEFVPMWTYKNSTAWKTLSSEEIAALENIFASTDVKQNEKWGKSANDILSALTSSVKMIPCGEDLGVSLECVSRVMKANKILSLKVIRWCRYWEKPNQPFVDFNDYDSLSLATTSVHDSPTIRQWWEEDKNADNEFIKMGKCENLTPGTFTEKTAETILLNAAKAKSVWCVHPIQDFLYLDKNYWLENAKDERINIPGEVTDFNWTYRLPCKLEDLEKNKIILRKIKSIVEKHL